jgi:hypothetical protein
MDDMERLVTDLRKVESDMTSLRQANIRNFADHKRRLDGLDDTAEAHGFAIEAIAAGQAGSDDGPAIPALRWDNLTSEERGIQLEGLRNWYQVVLLPLYGQQIGMAVKGCWEAHPAVCVEIGNLRQEWRRIYERQEPQLSGSLNFHDRWLPGALRRVDPLMTGCTARECGIGNRGWPQEAPTAL